jgi:4,5-dihydroxyphthalate decarboxylase
VSKLALTLACWSYDRTRALFDGRVRPDGIDLTCLDLPVEETFFRMLRHQEFDIAEMSLSSYVVSLFADDPPFVAIPVFPSRFFRHSCIYVNAAARIGQPEDLIDRTVGTPEYQMTAPVWIRGILADAHGVPVDSVTYATGGLEEPGRPEKLALDLPAGIRVRRIGPDQTLSAMLATGEIDALYTARAPSSFRAGDGRVRRLFEDFPAVERAYFRRTGIFPIMHTVVIRRDLYRRHRWIAQSLCKAFAAAQRDAYDDLAHTAALKTMLPWLTAHVEETRREMGEDYWPYGLPRNVEALATFLRYSHEQGLSRRRLSPDELFAPETLESFKI